MSLCCVVLKHPFISATDIDRTRANIGKWGRAIRHKSVVRCWARFFFGQACPWDYQQTQSYDERGKKHDSFHLRTSLEVKRSKSLGEEHYREARVVYLRRMNRVNERRCS